MSRWTYDHSAGTALYAATPFNPNPPNVEEAQRGYLDRASVFSTYYAENPLFKKNIWKHQTIIRLLASDNVTELERGYLHHAAVSMVTAVMGNRLEILSNDVINAAIMYQGMAPYLTDSDCATEVEANDAIRKAIIMLWCNPDGILENYCVGIAADATAYMAYKNQANIPAEVPAGAVPLEAITFAPAEGTQNRRRFRDLYPGEERFTGIQIADNTVDNQSAGEIMRYLLTKLSPDQRSIMVSMFTSLLISMPKRGQLDSGKLGNLRRELGSLGVTISTNVEFYKLLYRYCGKRINAQNAQAIFHTWQGLIPGEFQRLQLLLQQAAGAGLTSFSVITQAMIKHAAFPWDKIAQLYPDEMAKYGSAADSVANNPYYGFNQDLGVVKSTNYKNLAWVCKYLLKTYDGEGNLDGYGGWVSQPKEKARLDNILTVYAQYRDGLGNTAPTSADASCAQSAVAKAHSSTRI